jgi:succinate dehydrogenase hydrophobic anchor subunit
MPMTNPAPVHDARAQGVWAWILQRLSAVLLFVLLGTHLAVLHYVDENLVISFAGVAARMKSVLYLIVDGGLLSVGLYHALNGLRAVIFDFGFVWRFSVGECMPWPHFCSKRRSSRSK